LPGKKYWEDALLILGICHHKKVYAIMEKRK